MRILGVDLDGRGTALILGLVVGVVVAFTRRGAQTGDGKPFSGA